MTLPPGHHGSARKAVAASTPSPTLARLSWRWFVPQSRAPRITAGIATTIMALLMAALGPSTAMLFAGLGAFVVLIPGVAMRRGHPVGRVWRRDPVGAMHVGDAQSRAAALVGVLLLASSLISACIMALAGAISA